MFISVPECGIGHGVYAISLVNVCCLYILINLMIEGNKQLNNKNLIIIYTPNYVILDTCSMITVNIKYFCCLMSVISVLTFSQTKTLTCYPQTGWHFTYTIRYDVLFGDVSQYKRTINVRFDRLMLYIDNLQLLLITLALQDIKNVLDS
jgi:hypothetical protein